MAASREATWAARILDVSATGVGLVLSRRFEPGTALLIELPNDAADGSVVVIGRVRQVTGGKDGRWLVGCALASPLSDHDLHELLRHATTSQEPCRDESGAPGGQPGV
jgi:hypothetical protein